MENLISFSINRLQHAGVPESDISISETFYDRLCFWKVMQAPFMLEGDSGTCIMMKLEEIIIELSQLPETQFSEIRNRKNGHNDHIAFHIDNINVTCKEIKINSFQVLEAEPVPLSFWEKGGRYFNILGPDGELIAFNRIL